VSDTAVHANAWCGAEAQGELDAEASIAWGAKSVDAPPRPLGAQPLDLANWRDPRVGWGLVVPDSAAPAAEKAQGLDLAEPLRELLRRRGNAPVLRWRPEEKGTRLRRYYADGRTPADLGLNGKRGTHDMAVPRYLLIAAGPEHIPWRVQYRLQNAAFVGRLDLDAAGQARYVDALLSDWPDSGKSRRHPVVWAVDHGHPDITRLMRKGLAEAVAKALAEDGEHEFDMARGLLVDGQATGSALLQGLAERNPAFVMTSSHGATFPLDDAGALRANLGEPVDQSRSLLDLQALSAWDPAGCIWYGQACCSAGADGASSFEGIFDKSSSLASTLGAIAKAGSCQAPLPRALLGAARPARAFVGHVEPTFDWSLRDPVTGQLTTQSLVEAFYDGLHVRGGMPLGLALDNHFRAVGALLLEHGDAIDELNALGVSAAERARRAKLIAMDRLAMVILGDPTVCLAG
jgi:hypothetical protein